MAKKKKKEIMPLQSTSETPAVVIGDTKSLAADLDFTSKAVARAYVLFKGDISRIRESLKIENEFEISAILANKKVKALIEHFRTAMIDQATFEALSAPTPKQISWGDKIHLIEIERKRRGEIKDAKGVNATQINIGVGYE